jgi:DNA-binding FadR family transcriptional regulator
VKKFTIRRAGSANEVDMAVEMSSELLEYLSQRSGGGGERLPAIPNLAGELGISPGKLREQLEVARELGMVEVKPKTGIRTLGYSFYPAVRTSLRYALSLNPRNFEKFGELRSHLEAAFWEEAVLRLQPEDKERLRELVERSWEKLRGRPIQIPHAEHRALHLAIYSRLENPFVRGLLEAYWDAYEAVGLALYADYRYLTEVWRYHERIVEAIEKDDLEGGHRALVEHTGLLSEMLEGIQPGRDGNHPSPAPEQS